MTSGIAFSTAVSAREAEVLAAASEHLTNAEIAERPFISVRTVESHVSSLLRKPQLTDRGARLGRSRSTFPVSMRSGCYPRPRVDVGAAGVVLHAGGVLLSATS